jgi:Recombinase
VSRLSAKQTAAELDREGQSLDAIARHLNEQGFKSLSGKPWTHFMVEHLLRANGNKQEPLENIHRKAIAEARDRGLDYQQMADEFNRKGIRRRGGLRWTANSVTVRWSDLKRIQAKRDQDQSTEPIATKRSA